MKRFLRATTVTILLFMAALGASSSPALASDLKSPTQGASLSWGFTSEKFANRPRHIAGYTIHAKLRMSERDIGEKEVNALVRFGPERDQSRRWNLEDYGGGYSIRRGY
ncbi:DUF4258 domain-containing protein [Pseudonocardia sp. ICBG1142]|uniref:DUF4258 domain-containing protein n=1 Tax=Pseudonocardia sp. ICBG1142 TaxID=2846760 RepID=UPI001CF71272|nr:DUF4258 domain-containing protein [Pseudonocardia sp. ICBG1142]